MSGRTVHTAVLTMALLAGLSRSETCPSSRPHLVSAGRSTQSLYAWSDELVKLACRPANNGSCQWKQHDRTIGNDCSLSTSERGEIKCMQGEEICGVVDLKSPPDQDVTWFSGGEGYYGYSTYQYYGELRFSHFPVYLCRQSGSIIDEVMRCDSTIDCNDGEDEEECISEASCGPPATGEHSHLTKSQQTTYIHNASITYACDDGYSFKDTMGTRSCTCNNGMWLPARPSTCHRNMAAQRPVSGAGSTIVGMTREAAVDGQVNTWCMMTPGQDSQSLEISLAEGQRPNRILANTDNTGYQVFLQSNVRADVSVECACSTNRPSNATSYEIFSCDCLGGDFNKLKTPLKIVIRSQESALAVAEVVAVDTDVDAVDQCTLVSPPAHGRVQTVPSSRVRPVCDPGFYPLCDEVKPCQSEDIHFICIPLKCPPPPKIPRATVLFENGTDWRGVVQYACEPRYVFFPVDQPTTAVCGNDGLWSIGHISCVSETDIRVVTWKQGKQHQQSVDELRIELEILRAGQLQMLKQLQNNQQQLEHTQQQLNLTQYQLERTQQQLNLTQYQLDLTQQQLNLTQYQHDLTQQQLLTTQQQLQYKLLNAYGGDRASTEVTGGVGAPSPSVSEVLSGMEPSSDYSGDEGPEEGSALDDPLEAFDHELESW